MSTMRARLRTFLKRIPGIQRLYQGVCRSCGDWRYPFFCLRWVLAGLLVPRRTVRIDGISFTLPCSNWITHFRWYLFSRKEPEVRAFITEHLSCGGIFFDIGANIGVFSLYCAKKVPGVRVYAFEPEYANLALLKENIIENGLTCSILPYALALSDVTGISQLHLQDITPGAAAHSEDRCRITSTCLGYPVRYREGICTYTLDDLCKALGCVPCAMKIDTDGNEEKILRGAERVLANNALRAIIIELTTGADEGPIKACVGTLERHGFIRNNSSSMKRGNNQVWIRLPAQH